MARYFMSVAPAPAAPLYIRPALPEVIRPRPRKPGNGGLWAGLVLAAVMVAGAMYWRWRSTGNAVPAPVIGAIRTAVAKPANIEKAIRITGVTAAENFVSLVTPQLRGSRIDRLRDPSSVAPPSGNTASTASASS